MYNIMNNLVHHYDLKIIPAFYKSRPSKTVQHVSYTLIAVITQTVHSKSGSSPLHCFHAAGRCLYGGKVPRL